MQQVPDQEPEQQEISPTTLENLWFSSSMVAGFAFGLLGMMGLEDSENLTTVVDATHQLPVSAGFMIEQLRQVGISDTAMSVMFLGIASYFFGHRAERKAQIGAHHTRRIFNAVRRAVAGNNEGH
ncbi:MAG TPA: hypothetical protein VF209_02290 [Patescibacteria group bacterium]